jgi:hypothetical protein
MIVVPEGDASGLFNVYSANDGHNEIYTVDLRAETCECGDYEHRKPAGGCKHVRRVKLGLGLMPIPEGTELDGCLVHTREKYGVGEKETVVGAHTPGSVVQEAVATDGGQLVETDMKISVADDDSELLPRARSEITEHVEPPTQGGYTYYRCEACGTEAMRAEDLAADRHDADCRTLRSKGWDR